MLSDTATGMDSLQLPEEVRSQRVYVLNGEISSTRYVLISSTRVKGRVDAWI